MTPVEEAVVGLGFCARASDAGTGETRVSHFMQARTRKVGKRHSQKSIGDLVLRI